MYCKCDTIHPVALSDYITRAIDWSLEINARFFVLSTIQENNIDLFQ